MFSLRSDPCPEWIYDVLLSYCVNDDSAKSFASLLYTTLTEAGVDVFKDDGKLRSGDQISYFSSVLHAIGVSRISIIVFSRNYAASQWCMEELEKIMECRRTISQRVIPVFYEVDPSDVFMQEGAFGEGFEDKLISWRAALSEANNILGLHSVDSR